MAKVILQRAKSLAHRLLASLGQRSANGETSALSSELELSFDGISLLNWRVITGEITRVELWDKQVRLMTSDARPMSSGEPKYGELDLLGLAEAGRSRISVLAFAADEPVPFRVSAVDASERTQNIARINHCDSWHVETIKGVGAELVLVAEPARISVQAIRPLSGMVELEISAPDIPLALEVRERRGEGRIRVECSGIGAQGRIFRLAASTWDSAASTVSSSSTWDLWALPGKGDAQRLRWGGSDLVKPRDALRFRATSSRVSYPYKITMRPYWTADQYLALELGVINLSKKAVK